MLDGTSPPGGGRDATAVSIVPGSLRLGDGVDADGHTWPDPDLLLAALQDVDGVPPGLSDTFEPSVVPVPGRSVRCPPMPPPIELSRPAAPRSGATSASDAAWLNRPVPGMSALRAAMTGSAALPARLAGQKAVAAGEMAAGAAAARAGAVTTAAGLATTGLGIGVPAAALGLQELGLGTLALRDGQRRWQAAEDAAVTPHPAGKPQGSPPLVPPQAPLPSEGFPADQDAGRTRALVTLPILPDRPGEGFVVDTARGPQVVTIWGDGSPETTDWNNQKKHVSGMKGYLPGRSILQVDPQQVLDTYSGKGEPRGSTPRGQVGFKQRFDTGDQITGTGKDKGTGEETPTIRGTIHYSKKGAHVVPDPPRKDQGD